MKPEFIRQGPKLTEARLAEVEKRFGIQLPKEYRDFMLDKNGGEPEPTGVCRKRSKTPYLSCRYLFSIDTERSVEDWIPSFEGMKGKDEPTLPERIIPIGVDHGDNVYCLSVSGKDTGKVFWWDHENSFVPDPPKRIIPDMTGISLVADSFEKFLNQFAAEQDDHPEIKAGDWVKLVKKRDVNGVKAWLESGGRWDEYDMKTARSPLTLSIEMNEWAIVALLLDRGANPNSAIHHAIVGEAFDIVRAILKRTPGATNIDASTFAKALDRCTDISIIKGLLDWGAPIHEEHFGLNPLHFATVHDGSPEIVKLLLEQGAKLEQSSGDKQSALANAICNGQLEIAKLLLDAGDQLYKAPGNKTGKELKWEAKIKEEQAKPNPDSGTIARCKNIIEDARKADRPHAPVYYFDHPWKKLPPNFKKEVVAYAAKLGQKPHQA